MFSKKRVSQSLLPSLLVCLAIVAFVPAPAIAQEGHPVELPCVTGVTAFPMGQATPEDVGGQVLVLERLEIAPGGGFTAHTHPGTLIVSIESGTLELTQLDDAPMDVMHAAGTSEAMTPGTPMMLNPGDGFVESTGLVHTAFNTGEEPTVVLLSGLVAPDQPLVQCIEGTPTA